MKDMNLTEFYAVFDRLFASGWTIPEVKRLCHFRDSYQQISLDLSDLNLDMRQLEFIRWLVQVGMLSDG